MLAVERGNDFLLFVRLGREMAIQARHGGVNGIVRQLGKLRKAQGGMLEAGHPGHQRARDGAEGLIAFTRGGRLGRLVGRRGFRFVCLFIEIQHHGVEPAVFHHLPIQGAMAARHQLADAGQPVGVDALGQHAAVVIEDRRQPFLDVDQARLHQDAAQVAVQH